MSITSTAVLTLAFIVRPAVQIIKQANGSTIVRHNTEVDIFNCKPITKTEMLCPPGVVVIEPVE